jgi:hypothetical protein
VTVESPERPTSPHIRRAVRIILVVDTVLVAAAVGVWFLTGRMLWLYMILAPMILISPVVMLRAIRRAADDAARPSQAPDIVQ